MAITASGIGSGLDINGIVSQLMVLERRPVNLLQSRSKEIESQLSAYGKLRSSISSFESAMEGLGSLEKFKVYSVNSSDEDVITASTSSNAAKGTYDIVVDRLAQRHKMGSGSFAETDTFTGDLNITIGTDSFTINPSSPLSLEQIRDKINTATDNPGVTASIINVGGGNQRLVLTSDEEGFEQRLQISGTIATALNLQTINKDNLGATIPDNDTDLMQLDASFTVDGYAVTASSNKPDTVIDGVTFSLISLGSATVTVDKDLSKIEDSVKSFVDAYNSLNKTIRELSKGDLESDTSLRTIQGQIRSAFNALPVGLDSSFVALVEIGIKSDSKTGDLQFDSADLQDALNADFDGVAQLFANDDQGVAFRLAKMADNLLKNNNIVDIREDSLRNQIDDIEDSILNWEDRLELKERALRAKFSALDTLVGSMQSTSAFLSQQLF